MNNLTKTNKEIQNLSISGDVVPQAWYSHIKYKTEKGKTKTDLLAIAILANTVYWYKPTEVRDEKTNKIIGYRKKFELDMLQRSYAQLGEFYGKTKTEVRASIALLVDLKLIKLYFKTVNIRGIVHNNVMFIDLLTENIKKITTSDQFDSEAITKKRDRLSRKKGIGYHENSVEPITKIQDTNTETTHRLTDTTLQEEELTKNPIEKEVVSELRKIIEKNSSSPNIKFNSGNRIKLQDLLAKHSKQELLAAANKLKDSPNFHHWSIGGILQYIPDILYSKKPKQDCVVNKLFTGHKLGQFDGTANTILGN